MKSFYKIASNFTCLSLSEQQPGLNIIKQTASNVMAGSFEAMGRLERNISDLYINSTRIVEPAVETVVW